MHLDLTFKPTSADIGTIRRGLSRYNVGKVPTLAQYDLGDYTVILRENNQIVAGALCELDWGWLYFDSVWTSETVRGKGFGTLVMAAAETFAIQQGITRSYLFTTSFQARPFYEKIGYETFAQVDNHPRGHTFYYLRKHRLQATQIDPTITIDTPPIRDHADVIENGLLDAIADNEPLVVERIAVFLRDENQQIHGGMVGTSFWDWYDLQYLWIDDTYRGQGWAKQMLDLLENDLKSRNLYGIRCDTTSFQALPFYLANGFEVLGTLDNRPPEHTSYFLRKSFA